MRVLHVALEHALDLYGDPPRWSVLRENGMRADFSWKKSAQEYARLYGQLTPA